MKAVLYYGKEDLRNEEIDEPELVPGTVKIAPAYNGICGSDLSLYFNGPVPPAPTADEKHPDRRHPADRLRPRILRRRHRGC